MMGYDAVTLGNHEFDLKPGGPTVEKMKELGIAEPCD